MKGYIKVEAIDGGLKCSCELEKVDLLDRLHVVYVVAHALHIVPVELRVLAEMMESKDMPWSDVVEVPKESKEPKETKKAKVHVVEIDSPEQLTDFLNDLLK